MACILFLFLQSVILLLILFCRHFEMLKDIFSLFTPLHDSTAISTLFVGQILSLILQKQGVYPVIFLSGDIVDSINHRRSPALPPGYHSLLKRGDNLLCYLFVNIKFLFTHNFIFLLFLPYTTLLSWRKYLYYFPQAQYLILSSYHSYCRMSQATRRHHCLSNP